MPRIPLFPLNVVLFPGMQLKLYIFEERYKVMIHRCLEEQLRFGIVLNPEGQREYVPLRPPFNVGCSAEINEVKQLERGRFNILTTGMRRFRILSVDHSQPYLQADVQYFLPEMDRQELVGVYTRVLRQQVLRYIEIMSPLSGAQIDPTKIPEHPRAIAQIASILVHTDNAVKQKLLASDRVSDLLVQLVELYQLETLLMEVLMSPPDDDFDLGSFSSN